MRVKLNLAGRRYVHLPKLYTTYGLFGGALIALLVLQTYDLNQWHRQKTSLTAEINQFETQLGQGVGAGTNPEKLRELAGELRFANEILTTDSYRWTELLDRLEQVTGPGIRITSLTPNYRDNSLTLNGQARKLDDLRKFLETLNRSDGFTDNYLFQQQDLKVETSGRKLKLVGFSLVIRGVLS